MKVPGRINHDLLANVLASWPNFHRLHEEGYRIVTGIWSHIAKAMKIKNTLINRKWLYNQWRFNTNNLRDKVTNIQEEHRIENQDRTTECPVTLNTQSTNTKQSGNKGQRSDRNDACFRANSPHDRDAHEIVHPPSPIPSPPCSMTNSEKLYDTQEEDSLQYSPGASSVDATLPYPRKQTSDNENDDSTDNEWHFSLNQEEWKSIKPTGKKSNLQGQWAELYSRKFQDVNRGCVPVFKYNHVKLPRSRKHNMPYAKAICLCKFKTCCKYKFIIGKKPTTSQKKIRVDVNRLGNVDHGEETGEKRHIKGKRRGEVATELEKDGVTKWYYRTVASMTKEEKEAGNLSACATHEVLRRILADRRNKDKIHDDILQEVKLLQEVYKDIHPNGQYTDGGFVQYFSIYPFKVHLHLDDQLDLYIRHAKKQQPVLYLDATGSIIKKIPGQKKAVLYYALVMKNPIPGRSGIPVAEMLTNDQHASEIKHFLSRFVNTISKGKKLKAGLPRRVEVDFSWALIQSVLHAFNSEETKTYLIRTWKLVQGELSEGKVTSFTYPHICAAHMLKDVSRRLKEHTKDHGVKQFCLHVFALLQTEHDVSKARETFRHFCQVLDSKFATSAVAESLAILKRKISRKGASDIDDLQGTSTEATSCKDKTVVNRFKAIRESSPWWRAFKEEKEHAVRHESSEAVGNEYFTHGLTAMLLDGFMHVYPLWSAVTFGDLTRYVPAKKLILFDPPVPNRDTNSLVENWFGVVKKDAVPGGRTRLTPGKFIRFAYCNVRGRVAETQLRPSKGKVDVEAEGRNTSTPRRQGKYFRSPRDEDILQPKKKKKCPPHKENADIPIVKNRKSSKRARTSRKEDIPNPEEEWNKRKRHDDNKVNRKEGKAKKAKEKKCRKAERERRSGDYPRWGGRIQYKGKDVTLANTCTIDNIMVILAKVNQQQSVLRETLMQSSDIKSRRILHIADLCVAKEWTLAKLEWLHTICQFELEMYTPQTWDAYGSEFHMFVRHLDVFQANTQTSRCSSPTCRQAVVTRRSISIELGSTNDGKRGTVQDALNCWIAPPPCHQCHIPLATGERCSGERKWEERQFDHFICPPILCFSPIIYQSRTKGAARVTLMFQHNVSLGTARYTLQGMTIHKADHFTCIFKEAGRWYCYDGLTGDVMETASPLPARGETIGYLVYLLDDVTS